jgi:aminoglycoside phosphotransferase family enzyme/predicted kinase
MQAMVLDRRGAPLSPRERPDQDAVLEFVRQTEPGMRRVDTHASIVFLGQHRVLKIKRAVRLPFLDYSTLARRRAACAEELRVNKPFAPLIYRDVLPITWQHGGLALDGDGEAVEWAVEMSRFDETRSFEQLAARHELTPELATAVADTILAAHRREPAARTTGWVASITGLIERNSVRFRSVDGLLASDIDGLDARCHAALATHRHLLQQRAAAGFVRRCHGDLHLGNIVLIDGQPVLFDAIEFDPAIATTDILYDLAFPLMDLVRYGAVAEANALFNRYMEAGAEANREALALLPLFLSIRAAIRAHVLFTRSEQTGSDSTVRDQARTYFDLALELMAPPLPCLVAIGGLSGTGKSVLARGVAPRLGPLPGALILRSDVIRKKLFGINETERLPASAYTIEVTARVYEALLKAAERTALQGHSAILDAAFLRETERAAVSTLAPASIPHLGIFLTAERSVRIARIEHRQNDASDATPAVAIQQEGFALGRMDWPLIDAGGPSEQTLASALHCLKWPRFETTGTP